MSVAADPSITGIEQSEPRAARTRVLVGDLNAMPPGEAPGQPPADEIADVRAEALVPLLVAGYVDCYRALHPASPGYTYPTDQPWLRLDYFFASSGLAPGAASARVHRGGSWRATAWPFAAWPTGT